jgi:3',5'-cyclic AMP phosphodiesterase CpdA
MNLKIAVISDLHIGQKTRFADFRTASNEQRDGTSSFLESFQGLVEREGLKADVLVVPGDISENARPEEFAVAWRLVELVREKLGVNKDAVYVVPGNHDLDREVAKLGSKKALEDKHYYESLKFGSFSTPHSHPENCPLPEMDLGKFPFFKIWKNDKFLVLGYNSACMDGPDVGPHHGHADQKHLDQLAGELEALGDLSGLYKIVLVHHHFLSFSNPLPDFIDHSQMTNADNFMKMLEKFKFDFAVHGHRHVPRFRAFATEIGWPIPVLCAGSLSAVLHADLSGHSTNQFHLIEIEGRNLTEGSVFGTVKNWAYLSGKGWLPSSENWGIEAVSPFGTFLRIAELVELVRNSLAKLLATKSSFEWKEIEKVEPKLKYVSSPQLQHAISMLRNDPNFEIFGGDDKILIRAKQKAES